MQVIDLLPAMRVAVDDQPIAVFRNALTLGEIARDREHMADQRFVFVGNVAFDWIFVVAERRLHGMALVSQLTWWTPLAALLTAVVGLVVMSVVRPTMDRRRP